MPDDPRYEVKDPAVQATLIKLGGLIRASLPPGWGFSLFLVQYGPDGAMFYLSSANRDDMVQALREWLAREGVSSVTTRQTGPQ